MNQSAASVHPNVAPRRLSVMRVVWVGTVVAMVFLWLIGQPVFFHFLVTPCASDCGDFIGFTADQWRVLRAAGITPLAYAAAYMVFLNLALLVWLGVGLLIFVRRGSNLGMLVISLALASNELMVSAPQLGVLVVGPALMPLVGAFAAVGQVLWYSIFYLFPDGRFVPRWSRWFFLLGVAAAVLLVVVPPTTSVGEAISSVVSVAVYPVVYLVAIGAQIYRYRRAATPVQRQQSKWAVTGILIAYACQLALLAYSTARSDAVGYVVAATFVPVVQVAIPISVGIAILRYRLYDIDLLINRTLVYGSLTALLAGVYFGSVLAMQHLAIALAGTDTAENPLILVLSTLLIAALFQPLRVRIQRTIDRRFYRQKYDAAKALASFAATLRGEVELADLERHLVGVVDEAMQPAHISLWIAAGTQARNGETR